MRGDPWNPPLATRKAWRRGATRDSIAGTAGRRRSRGNPVEAPEARLEERGSGATRRITRQQR